MFMKETNNKCIHLFYTTNNLVMLQGEQHSLVDPASSERSFPVVSRLYDTLLVG